MLKLVNKSDTKSYRNLRSNHSIDTPKTYHNNQSQKRAANLSKSKRKHSHKKLEKSTRRRPSRKHAMTEMKTLNDQEEYSDKRGSLKHDQSVNIEIRHKDEDELESCKNTRLQKLERRINK